MKKTRIALAVASLIFSIPALAQTVVGQGTATGTNSSSQDLGVADGNGATTTDIDGTAVGYQATAGKDGTATGYTASAQNNAVAVGSQTQANTNAVSVGFASGEKYNATGSTQLGYNANANTNGVALGMNSNAGGADAMAFGYQAAAAGGYSLAYGVFSQAAGTYDIALGYQAGVQNGSGGNNVSIGYMSGIGNGVAGLAFNVSVGQRAGYLNTGSYGVALGAGSYVTANYSVALGYGSVSTSAYDVSVGTPSQLRTISNVANATSANQAVNLSQLQSAIAGVSTSNPLALNYDDSSFASVTLQGTNGTIIHNVASGVASTDAANVGQVSTAQTNAENYADTDASNTLTSAKSYTDTQLSNLSTSVTSQIATATQNQVSYDAGSSQASITLQGSSGTQIHNLAPGTSGTDAVNLSQLTTSSTANNSFATTAASTAQTNAQTYASSQASTALTSANSYTDSQIAAVNTSIASQIATATANQVSYDTGSSQASITLKGASGTVIHNLANGTASTDAVNLGQMDNAIASATAGLSNPLALSYDSASFSSITLQGTSGTLIHNVADGVASTDAANVGQVNTTATTTLTSAKAYADTQVSNLSTTVTSQIATATQNQVAYDAGSSQSSITLAGASGTQIHNLAPGTAGTDAVDVNQLNSAIASATAGVSNPLAMSYDNASFGSVTLMGVAGTLIHNVAPGVAGMDAVNMNQLNAVKTQVATLSSTVASIQASTPPSNGSGSSSGSGAVTTNPDGSVTVSGQVHNVSAGTSSTDAANTGQVADAQDKAEAFSQTIGNQSVQSANAYTDTQISNLNQNMQTQFNQVNSRIDDLSNRIDGVAAMSAASGSNMYNPYSGNDNQVGVGVANYRGAVGYSVGYFHKFSDHLVSNVKVSGATQAGGVAVSGGMNFGW